MNRSCTAVLGLGLNARDPALSRIMARMGCYVEGVRAAVTEIVLILIYRAMATCIITVRITARNGLTVAARTRTLTICVLRRAVNDRDLYAYHYRANGRNDKRRSGSWAIRLWCFRVYCHVVLCGRGDTSVYLLSQRFESLMSPWDPMT